MGRTDGGGVTAELEQQESLRLPLPAEYSPLREQLGLSDLHVVEAFYFEDASGQLRLHLRLTADWLQVESELEPWEREVPLDRILKDLQATGLISSDRWGDCVKAFQRYSTYFQKGAFAENGSMTVLRPTVSMFPVPLECEGMVQKGTAELQLPRLQIDALDATLWIVGGGVGVAAVVLGARLAMYLKVLVRKKIMDIKTWAGPQQTSSGPWRPPNDPANRMLDRIHAETQKEQDAFFAWLRSRSPEDLKALEGKDPTHQVIVPKEHEAMYRQYYGNLDT